MNTQLQKLKSYPRHGQTFNSNNLGNVNPNLNVRTALPGTAVNPTYSSTNVTPNIIDPNDPVVQRLIQQRANILAQQIIADQAAAAVAATNGRVYTKFDIVNDIINNQTEVITGGMWSDSLASLTSYYSGSAQTTSQRRYYVDVYQKDTTLTGSAVQFSIAYGHALGSGSDSQGQLNDSPSKAIYSQYKQLLLPSYTSNFSTNNSGSTNSIYVININRSRLKERMDPGNFELPLANITSRNVNATGSVGVGSTVYTLIDDSTTSSGSLGISGRVYNIVSGSLLNGIYNTSAPEYYGVIYPDHGILVLDGNVLDQKLGFKTNVSSSSEGNNHFTLFNSISGSALVTNPATSDPYGFQARNSEKLTSTHYFVRIKNAEYNFSNNPSYVTGSVGRIAEPSFIGDPKTYITTIGLYNDNQELLAVAKLSKPLLKSFQREALIRVKLDY